MKSDMHIYSSPRNMSINVGSVSTKHEQTRFLTVYILWCQQTLPLSTQCWFLFPFFSFSSLLSGLSMSLLPFMCFVVGHRAPLKKQLPPLFLTVSMEAAQLPPPPLQTHTHTFLHGIFEVCVLNPQHGLFQAGEQKNTA